MSRRRRIVSLVCCATALVACPPATASAATLPRVDVRVGGPIGDAKVTAHMTIRGRTGYRGRIGIELRGSTSRRFPKKSYALETRSRGTAARNAALLGMPRENDWILNAVHSDPTLARDALAYVTARRLGRWAPRTRFVELFVNRRYQGVYLLAEQLKLDAARVDVVRRGISGGYLVEWSTTRFAGGFQGPVSGLHFGHKDPKAKQLKDAEAAWIAGYVMDAERSLARRDGSWRTFVDESAAADYLLLQELFANFDAFQRSTFLTKATDAPLALGPIWDFDRSMGLTHHGVFAAAPHGWITPGRPWASDLLADAPFADGLAARWSTWRAQGLLDRMLRDLDRSRRALAGAQVRNARRWRSTRTASHVAQMRLLRTWLRERVAWIDSNIHSLGATTRGSAP